MIDFRTALSGPQYEAATHMDGPLLVLAGAGSGKTRTLVHRVAYLVERGIPAEEILLLTFTNKAAQEMQERAVQLLDERCNDITACTYHSFCAQMLHDYKDIAGLPEGYAILMQTDVDAVLDIVLGRTYDTSKLPKGYPNANRLFAIFSSSTNRGMGIEEALRTDQNLSQFSKLIDQPGFIGSLENLREKYTEYKTAHNMVDYDDLMTRFRCLLVEHPEVRAEIGGRYSHIMVDEYQDSNALQVSIVFLLRQSSRNLMVVGDDYQSIYGFRGADVANILRFPDMTRSLGTPEAGMEMYGEYKAIEPGTDIGDIDDIVYLDKNYRSSSQIVNLANVVMDRNATFGFKKTMTAAKEGDCLPEIHRLRSEADEVRYVIEQVREWHDDEGYDYADIAVLSRTSKKETELLARELRTSGIPMRKFGGQQLFGMECVANAIAYLRASLSPRDEVAWHRILSGLGFDQEKQDYLTPYIQGMPGMEFLDRPNWMRSGIILPLLDLRADMRAIRQAETLRDALGVACRRCQELAREQAREEVESAQLQLDFQGQADAAQRLREVERETTVAFAQLQVAAGKYDSIRAFIDAVALGEITGDETLVVLPEEEADEEPDAIAMSTVHSVKGLEYRAVIILNCVDRVFPKIKNEEMGTEADMEELRCFYVAITRAQERLCLCCPTTTRIRGNQFAAVHPSHYLSGIDDNVAVTVYD